MAVTANSVILPQTPRCQITRLTEGVYSQWTNVDIFNPGTDGAKVSAIQVSCNEATNDVAVYLVYSKGGTGYVYGAIEIVSYAGYSESIPAVDLLQSLNCFPVDGDGQHELIVEAGDHLEVFLGQPFFTGSSGKKLDIVVIGGDF